MMEKEVLDYKAPLYGRRTGSLKLEEMSFFELKDFFPGKSIRELIDVDVYENLKRKIELVKWHKDFEVGKIVIFSASGFKKPLLDLAVKERNLELVSIDEMLYYNAFSPTLI